MLVETTMKYYDKKYDLNCAECMLVAVNEVYDLNISNSSIRDNVHYRKRAPKSTC